LSWDWHGRGEPGYDEDLSRVQGDEWRNCAEGSVYGLFFNATFCNHHFHGFLCTSSIHMSCCLLNCFKRAIGIRKYQLWMTMFSPECPQSQQSEIRQGYQSVFNVLSHGGYELVYARHQYHRLEEIMLLLNEDPLNRWLIKKHDSVIFVLPQ